MRFTPLPLPWTDNEDTTLRDLYPDPKNTKAAISKALGRSVDSIDKRAKRLGIVRPPLHPARVGVVAPSSEGSEGRAAAQENAERIRAYYARQGRAVTVDIQWVSGGRGQNGTWSARIVTPIALGVQG